MLLLGAALLACALALYWYASSNTPQTLKEPGDLGDINRAAPASVNPAAQPTPSASPSSTHGANGAR
jgi:hypothetical protein